MGPGGGANTRLQLRDALEQIQNEVRVARDALWTARKGTQDEFNATLHVFGEACYREGAAQYSLDKFLTQS